MGSFDVSFEKYVLFMAILLISGILSTKLMAKIGMPALLIYIGLGMLAGSEGIGNIAFDDPGVAKSMGVFALQYIIFDGGLRAEVEAVQSILVSGVLLSTIGVLITGLIMGWAAVVFFGLSWPEGFLLGAVLSSTDAAAIFSVLGNIGQTLSKPVRSLLEFESGSNDPMAVLLTVGLVQFQIEQAPLSALMVLLMKQILLGAAIGSFGGWLAARVLRFIGFSQEALYPTFILALVPAVYASAQLLQGSGLLAVYLMGLVLSYQEYPHKRYVMRFQGGVSWLMQISVFLMLGLFVFPSRLRPVMGPSLVLSLILIFVARPAAVLVSLLHDRRSFREKILISWVGLRGATPIILATFPMVARLPKADAIFNITFFAVITSVLIQGTSLSILSRTLKVRSPRPSVFAK